MPFDIETLSIITYVIAGIVIILAIYVIHLHTKLKRFLVGKNPRDLEDTLVNTKMAIEEHRKFEKEMQEYLTTVEKRLRSSVQNVETIRFNPFKGTGSGGNQSFATAFINENGDGVVISSLYARDRISIFSKPIENYKSPFELTTEEKTVVEKSKKSN